MLEKDKYYSMKQLIESGVFPVNNTRRVRDLLNNGEIKAVIYGSGLAKRYYIKGEWIFNYLESLNIK